MNKRAKSVRPKDPLSEFKKSTRGEMGRYSVEGEVWRALWKLSLVILALAAAYFAYECWLAYCFFK